MNLEKEPEKTLNIPIKTIIKALCGVILIVGIVGLILMCASTKEVLSKSEPYIQEYPIERIYQPSRTRFVSNGKGGTTMKYEAAKYYFRYNGHRVSVLRSTYNMPYTHARLELQDITYKRTPTFSISFMKEKVYTKTEVLERKWTEKE